jgi:O-antigen ligase
LAGLLLTFSRSAVIAIIGSILIFLIASATGKKRVKNLFSVKVLTALLVSVFAIAVTWWVISTLLPSAIDFYWERLFSLETSSGAAVYDFKNPEASEGFRVFMMKIISEFVFYNPFTGSGYLGSWILFDDLSGSAHNQYLDVLFRTGVIGFGAYLWLLYRLLRFLRVNEPSLFWGVIGVLIYGLFHETFKLSQGAFILSFMLGMMVQKRASVGSHVQHYQ